MRVSYFVPLGGQGACRTGKLITRGSELVKTHTKIEIGASQLRYHTTLRRGDLEGQVIFLIVHHFILACFGAEFGGFISSKFLR